MALLVRPACRDEQDEPIAGMAIPAIIVVLVCALSTARSLWQNRSGAAHPMPPDRVAAAPLWEGQERSGGVWHIALRSSSWIGMLDGWSSARTHKEMPGMFPLLTNRRW